MNDSACHAVPRQRGCAPRAPFDRWAGGAGVPRCPPPPGTLARLSSGRDLSNVASATEYHVTVIPYADDPAFSVATASDAVMALKPTSVLVDCGGSGIGRVLLASLQAKGLPAKALEKRERPSLLEVSRVTELTRELKDAQHEAELLKLELKMLREYQRDIRVLINRLDND